MATEMILNSAFNSKADFDSYTQFRQNLTLKKRITEARKIDSANRKISRNLQAIRRGTGSYNPRALRRKSDALDRYKRSRELVRRRTFELSTKPVQHTHAVLRRSKSRSMGSFESTSESGGAMTTNKFHELYCVPSKDRFTTAAMKLGFEPLPEPTAEEKAATDAINAAIDAAKAHDPSQAKYWLRFSVPKHSEATSTYLQKLKEQRRKQQDDQVTILKLHRKHSSDFAIAKR